jgi:transposase
MRPTGSAKQLERRRRQAVRLLRAGKNLSAAARAIGASVSSVFRWWQTYRKRGLKGLKPRPTPGRPPRLDASEKRRLERLLLKGPLEQGYRTDLWTLPRISQVIDTHFAVRYHPGHVWRLLRDLGWSCQKPERRALQRDERAIELWKRQKWPHIKKGRATWSPSRIRR